MPSQSEKRCRFLAAVMVCAGVLGAAGCREPAHQVQANSVGPHSHDAGSPRIITYPLGRWRLAQYAELENVALWVSHIVIGFKGSQLDQELWGPGWQPNGYPTRSRAAAESLILEAGRELERPDADFARIAERFSDDVVTKDRGGSLGGVRASHLPLEYRDAVEQLKIGGTSAVFESAAGFHIIRWREPPLELRVAGQRLVITYGSDSALPDAGPVRGREDALRRANSLADEARRSPQLFDDLIANDSEGYDRESGGDMGVWSTRDPELSPREVEQLAALAMGEVSRPLDSAIGFQIIKRVPARAAQAYSVEAVYLSYDASRPATEGLSRSAVYAQASALAKAVKRDPENFAALEKKAARRARERWSSGRTLPGLVDAIAKVKIGEFTPLIEAQSDFILARRLDPDSIPTPRIRLALPSPIGPNIAGIVRHTDGKVLAQYLQRLVTEMGPQVTQNEQERELIVGSFTNLAQQLEKLDPDQRGDKVAATLGELRRRLASSTYDALVAFVRSRIEGELLQKKAVMSR